MSNVIIKRAVENIRRGTSVYTPIIELVVNSIQAIEEKGNVDEGEINVVIKRSGQTKTDSAERDITGFTIEDNGIGFTPKNRESFDTLYTDKKIKEGGKGFGRFTCLKYFEDVHVSSTFAEGDSFLQRTFKMGKKTEIIVDEEITESESAETGTKISLKGLKTPIPERTVNTISRVLVEKLLPFFIKDDKKCPKVYLADESGEKVLEGREIQIAANTPLYGYVICELTRKVKEWLEEVKDFKPLPDRMGYFRRHSNLNLYIEVLSWEKVLKDSTMRNKIFFHKLGLE